jgi:hypothetical protein
MYFLGETNEITLIFKVAKDTKYKNGKMEEPEYYIGIHQKLSNYNPPFDKLESKKNVSAEVWNEWKRRVKDSDLYFGGAPYGILPEKISDKLKELNLIDTLDPNVGSDKWVKSMGACFTMININENHKNKKGGKFLKSRGYTFSFKI